MAAVGEGDGLRLAGGFDQGAVRRGDRVQRVAGAWTPAVHHLLAYLADHGFTGAPRPVRSSNDHGVAVDEVTFLEGETIGDRRPWPAWVHSDAALRQVAGWLACYHRLVDAYEPPAGAVWRESHAVPGKPGVVIAHNDAAPYNAVWEGDRLVGFIDWDMAGPRSLVDDLAWTAFSWVPLHARHVVEAEGFTEWSRRRDRLAVFLDGYGTDISPEVVLARLDVLLGAQVELMNTQAEGGDDTYQRMIQAGRADDLITAQRQLRHLDETVPLSVPSTGADGA